jgi:hypothetical protein
MFNAGIDFSTVKGILRGSIEAYVKKGSDLYGAAPFDPTAGLNGQAGIVRNVANMQGKGIDVNIESRNLNHTLKWSTRLLFSYNTDKTTRYYVDSNRRSGSFINDGFLINPLVGKPLYAIIALPWGGLDDQGNPKGYVGQKLSTDYYTITQQTRKEDLIYKPSLPKIFGSLINTFSWRSIRLSVNIGYRFDYYFMKPSLSYTSLFEHGARVGSADFSRRWKQPGDERHTNVPSMIYPANNDRDIFYNASAALLRRADNIRLRYLNLSYDINKGEYRRLPFQHLQVYLHAEDLGILWRRNKDGLDPDYISSVPTPGKTWSIGIRAKF